MSRNKGILKVLSLLITIMMVLGYLTSFVYAEGDKTSSARVELIEEASKKLMPEVVEDLEKEELIEILVYMEDQVDTSMIAEATRKAVSSYMTPHNTKLAVRRGVVEALRDKAEISQLNLLKYLEQEKEKGNVVEFTSYSIVNIVYVKATKEVVENISYMPEVAKVYKNKTHQMEKIILTDEQNELNADGVEWNIERIRANEAWDLGIDGTGAVVGSLDSGVDWTHPALKNKWRGYDPNTGETNPDGNWFDPVYFATLPADSDSHGTHVMGTAVGQEPDGSNKVGVAPGAKWIAARVFNTAGSTTDRLLLDAAEWMAAPGGNPDNAPDVVNNSWGGGAGIDDWYREAVNNWRAAEILPVFSAGNQRTGEPAPWPGSISVPANYPESFAVAATDRNDSRASFSKLGPSPYDESLIKPNISAPGVGIRSSIPGGGYTGTYSGTSMSAPHISGTAALLMSANSSLTVEDLEEIIQNTARGLTDGTYPESPNFGYGYGIVDAFEAVSQVASGTGYISGRVLQEGEDVEDAVIIHEQEVFETYAGSDIDIEAEITDDVAVTEVELLVKQQGKSYWLLVPMNKISGDHKSGVYKGTITYDMLIGDSIIYKIRARDYAGEAVITKEHKIDIKFGILPDEYTQGFESNPIGWTFDGSWEWGVPSGNSPEPYEGENVAGTNLSGNYSANADDWLITPPMDLRDATLDSATLRFHEWYELENNWDKGYTLISNDYGENWVEVRPIITGDGKEWKETVINLGDYVGSKTPVFVAFRLTSDSSVHKAGWYIDNVRLVGVDNEPPAIPTELTAEPFIRGIKLDWESVSDGDLSYYNVYRSEVSGEGYEKIAEVPINTFVDSAVDANTTYYYVVEAVDFSGNVSGYSNEVSATALEFTNIFGTNFEEDDGGFITGVTEGTENCWEWGIPTSGPNVAVSGEKLWATNLTGNYTARNDAYIESPAIEIPEGSNPILTFTHWYDFEGTTTKWDYGQVLVSKDDGETWINITPEDDGKYGRRVQEWKTEELSLADFDGETIKIRFFFHSDGSVFYSGWYVDDVYVVGAIDGNEVPEYPDEPEIPEEPEVKKADYVDPVEPSFKLDKLKLNEKKVHKYERIEDSVASIGLMARGSGIPVENAVVTVLETGRSVKADPVTGRFNMRAPIGEYTIRAEAYGYYSQDATVVVEEEKTVNHTFMLEQKPQGTITGRVFDRYYLNPASYAVIRVVEDGNIKPVIADEDGNFTIEGVYEGVYTLKVTADGFEPGEATVEVVGNEVTNIDIALKRFVGYEDEISYDNDIPTNALVLNAANNGLAVRFTPSEYGKVVGANIYFWGNDWPTPGGTEIGIAIFDTDNNGNPSQMVGEPKIVNVNRGEWNLIDLSEFGFATDRDFFIATVQPKIGDLSPGVGIDETSPAPERSYLHIGGEEFTLIGDEGINGGLMIRARVENSVDTPIITNLEEINYTNQDIITVEGAVNADGKVNVYVNNVKSTSVEAENGVFTAEVDLPLEENEIMVTAELNGRETEPSAPVVVIKDKEAPELIVIEPVDNTKINTEVVHVRGNATDNIELVQVLINDVEVVIDEDGNFHKRLIVDPGENLIVVKAIDGAGNETIIERTVYVGLDAPIISNIEPSEDVELKTGDILTVSFEAPSGGEGYFRILMPFGSESNEIGIPMVEEDGVYTGTWTVPRGLMATGLQVQVVYIDEFGTEVMDIAPGTVRIVLDEEPTDPYTDIENVEPSEDNTVRAGDRVEISFNGPAGGSAYYKLVLPFETTTDSNGSPMVEGPNGFYSTTWLVPEGLIVSDLQVEVILIVDEQRLNKFADGKITVVGSMEYLPNNSIIINDEAFDSIYIDRNVEAQRKLMEAIKTGTPVYTKISKTKVIDMEGNLASIDILPRTIKFFDANGNIRIYERN